MIKKLSSFFYEWSQKRAFEAYQSVNQEIIFYSESYNYWPHFESIIKHLWEDHGKRVIYLTSDKNDFIFINPPQGVTSFYIGDSYVRTAIFIGLQGPLVVMTMPDLEVFYLKRSPRVKHYAYIFHSINSCHMIYRPHAFDFYDTIFCVGPHQVREIRSLEVRNNTGYKNIIEHGYARLEALTNEFVREQKENSRTIDGEELDLAKINILIAPTWGPDSLLERHSEGDFIEILLNAGFLVTLRPHPETHKHSANLIKKINERYHNRKNFKLEYKVASMKALLEADIMISDYSGVAMEFALSRLKPVLFVDVPKKVNNPDYTWHQLVPIEDFIRKEIGMVIQEDKLSLLDSYIYEILKNPNLNAATILEIRDRHIYNFGRSGEIASNELSKLF